MSELDYFRIRVAGTSFRQDAVRLVDDGDAIRLVPDPDNRHDGNAVKVMAGDRWLGFVPRDRAESVKAALDGGCTITGRVIGKKKPEGSDSYGVLIELQVQYPD